MGSLLVNRQFMITALILLVIVFAAGVGVAALVILLRRKEPEEPFRTLEYEPQPEEPVISRRQGQLYDEGEDYTRRIFSDSGIGLNSYCIELRDVNQPSRLYQASISDRITIGRRQGCAVVIPDQTLSGSHCEILLRDGKLFLNDLGSLNGTFLNNVRVEQETRLASGSVIRLGKVRLKVNIRAFSEVLQ